VAAIVTPTSDVFNMCVFAFPTIGLYLLGVGAAALFGAKRPAPDADEELEAGQPAI
jgi:sec-independent protein translocase protein TatC